MEKKKLVKIISDILIFIIAIGISYYIFSDKGEINDYYTYINKDLFDKTDIKEDEFGYSNFTLAQDKVDDKINDIIDELRNNNTNPNLNIFYNNIINTEARNKLGLKPLQKYIDKIDNSKNINELINNAIEIDKTLNIDMFMIAEVESDFKDTSKKIIYLSPITFDFGMNADYYVNDDYSRYLALIKQYRIKLLKLYGYDTKEAKEISNKINDLFTDIASNSKQSEELSNVDNLYNIITKDELQKIYTNLDVNKYLKSLKIDNQEYYSIVDKGNYETLNKYLTNDNLDLLKYYEKIKLLENLSQFTSVEYSKLISDFQNDLLGIEDEYDVEDDAVNYVSSFFVENIDEIYANKYFTKENKEFIENMIKDMLSYYEENFNNINWLSKETREKAILKLKNMKVNVGYPEKFDDYSKLYNLKSFEEGSNLIENIISINSVLNDYSLSKLNSDTNSWEFSLTTVNAYYNPLDNSINFPAALVEMYDLNNSYYENLGSIGFIIAHEITHAFDNNGSLFDENGNRVDWWTNEDKEKFKDIQNEVIEYYNNFEVLNGLYVNGKKTVGENIADLGAVNCIVNISKKKGATNEDYKKLFSSYAKFWASEYIDSYTKILLLQDTHSPDKIRVNAVLSSNDKFYDVYNIKKNDDMYISEDDRVKVW